MATIRRLNNSYGSLRNYWREALAMLMLLLAFIFFRSERKEITEIIPHLKQANPSWLSLAIFLTLVTYILQAGMYRQSFAAISFPLNWWRCTELYLKRNFLGVFLPAGGVSALAYSPPQIRKAGFTKLQIHQASGLYGFAGLLSVFIAGLPVVIYTSIKKELLANSWVGLIAILLTLAILLVIVNSFRKKYFLYSWFNKKFPSAGIAIAELLSADVSSKKFAGAVIYSLGVELCGMLQIYCAMLALGLPASFGAASSIYIISLLVTVMSPFLKGLGAVEFTIVYILARFGYSSAHAIAITIFYRAVEFWLPLLTGLLIFSWKAKSMALRIAPAILSFLLGLINIISVIAAPLQHRLQLLHDYIPFAAIHASHLLVLFTGLMLLATSAFLFRGLRNAWIIALVLSLLSVVGHLGKAQDSEEVVAAAISIAVLMATSSQYRIRSSNKWMKAGIKIAILNFIAVLLFSFISFYFIDVRHFAVDFTWKQSLIHTLKVFLLTEDLTLHPVTRFGHEFIWLIRSLGFLTWGFLVFTLIKPAFRDQAATENYREKAMMLVNQFGNSSNDYFKTYKDKLFYFAELHDGFVAFRIAIGFAIVLEEPVCAGEHKEHILAEFNSYCRKQGLKPAFYRVDENSIPWFNTLRKKKIIIGQEAILDLKRFSLEGRDKKSLRNGINNLNNKGFYSRIHPAPQTDALLSQIHSVSDKWLSCFHKQELVFSQGMFDDAELKQQDIITVEDAKGNIKAFLNIIPDFNEGECTYDLIRKTKDAPAASMDALVIKLIEYAQSKNKLYLNLGLAPITGILQPDNTAEQILKLASSRMKRFQHFKTLRDFKEKYATIWENKYLVYENDFDLLQLPRALNIAMKP